MALKIKKENQSGVNVEYWKVSKLSLDYQNSNAEISLHGYIDAEKRAANKSPLQTWTQQVSGDEFRLFFKSETLDTKNPIKSAYQFLKSIPDWASAEDV